MNAFERSKWTFDDRGIKSDLEARIAFCRWASALDPFYKRCWRLLVIRPVVSLSYALALWILKKLKVPPKFVLDDLTPWTPKK
jgi:hypothetical protein